MFPTIERPDIAPLLERAEKARKANPKGLSALLGQRVAGLCIVVDEYKRREEFYRRLMDRIRSEMKGVAAEEAGDFLLFLEDALEEETKVRLFGQGKANGHQAPL